MDYFVSFSYISKDGLAGFGNGVITGSQNITINELLAKGRDIQKIRGYESLTILYYKEM